jgi:TonB family protein
MNAQAAEKLKQVTTRTGARPKITEQYTVRLSDGLREGRYTRSRGKAIVQTGNYKNGMRDSLWTDYALGGQKIAEGRMSADRKTGVWAYYSFAGDTIQLFDHDRGRMLRYDRETEMTSFPKGFLSAESLPDTPLVMENITLPAYIGGMTMILHLFSVNLSYPARDLENGVQGIVRLGFTVDKQGRTRDLRILKSVSPGIDEEALRLGALLGDNWIPGEMDGEKAAVRFTMPLQFKLD